MTTSTQIESLISQRNQLIAASGAGQLEELNNEISRLESEQAIEQQTAEHKAKLKNLVSLASKGTEALSDYEEHRAALAASMMQHLQAISMAKLRLQNARQAFIAEVNLLTDSSLNRLRSSRISPGDAIKLEAKLNVLISEVEAQGANLSGVLIADMFLGSTTIDRNYQFADQGPITQLIDMVINQSSNDYAARSEVERHLVASAIGAPSF